MPDARAPLRRSRQRKLRRVETRRTARRLRSDAGDGLQTGQQISAAAATTRWRQLDNILLGRSGRKNGFFHRLAAAALDRQSAFALKTATACILPFQLCSLPSFPAAASAISFCFHYTFFC